MSDARIPYPGYNVDWVEIDGARLSFDFDPNRNSLPGYQQRQAEAEIKKHLVDEKEHWPGDQAWDDGPYLREQLIPEEARIFGPANFFFNFRQNLEFLCNCIDNVPELDVIVLVPTWSTGHMCADNLCEFIRGTSLEGQMTDIQRHPQDSLRFRNGSVIRFVSTDHGRNGQRLRGYRPDFFIVKELTRSDW